ncbi:hypothetical protein E2C01_032167 [Portunus trituberculatus]|uniref:Uncharacterized protein n=1 Tax=Portunus trituberculatus TaxID=210409 RepID=A0A5B7EZW0_PORTR|nr:hypothetical protein [Portunus trituberculatus]
MSEGVLARQMKALVARFHLVSLALLEFSGCDPEILDNLMSYELVFSKRGVSWTSKPGTQSEI